LSRFWFPARIALIFLLVMGSVLGGAFYVFRQTVGLHFRREFVGKIQAVKAVLLAAELEQRVTGPSFRAPETEMFLRARAAARGIELALLGSDGAVQFSTTRELKIWRPLRTTSLECGDRRCKVTHEPPYATFVPLRREGRAVATLALTQVMPIMAGQQVFIVGLLLISFLGMLGVVGFSIYITRPLRRMSHSMDRIAGGELEHRVQAKGRDEVAHMGRSFNTMADRVGTMIASQKELMAGLSHELRSPLSRMKLTLEMLRESGADAGRVDALDREVDALDRLMDELLTLSKMDLDAATLKLGRVALQELVETGWQRVSEEAESRQIPLQLEISPDATAVLMDRALGVRIFGNLLENAVRYGDGTSVTVVARRAQDRLNVTVSDRGPGVRPEALLRLFEPFFRAGASRSRRVGGTGLGLMIVSRAIEAHGGTVNATLAEGGGLAISFDLPAA
jgi:signal transduction histidine kinase